MPYYVYGRDRATHAVIPRQVSEAATRKEARSDAEARGIEVTSVVRFVAERRSDAPFVAEELDDPADVRDAFVRRLEQRTPQLYATWVIVAVNLLVFLAMVAMGANATRPMSADLLRFGANFGPRVFGGEPWRIISAMFVHIGLLHVMSNMLCLMYVAPTVERMLGNLRFAMIYLVTGTAGGLLALYFDPMLVTAGASAAVFGIYGTLLGVLLKRDGNVPKPVAGNLWILVVLFVGLNLFASLKPGISLAAHVGGVVAGVCCGVLMPPMQGGAASAGWKRRAALCASGIVLLVGGFVVDAGRFRAIAAVTSVIERSHATMTAYKEALRRYDGSELSSSGLVSMIESDLLPQWRAERSELGAIADVPLSYDQELESMVDYMNLREQAWKSRIAELRDHVAQVSERRRARDADIATNDEKRANDAAAAIKRRRSSRFDPAT